MALGYYPEVKLNEILENMQANKGLRKKNHLVELTWKLERQYEKQAKAKRNMVTPHMSGSPTNTISI